MMETLSNKFVDHLIDSNYIGPTVSKSVGLTERNLKNIYNLIFRPQYSRETGEACSVSAEALLQYMGQHGFLRLNKEQVAGFPRHNITCPVTGLGSTAKLSAGQAEEVRRMKLGPRSAVCVAAAQQPGTDLALQRLVAGVTRAHANFVFIHNTQTGSGSSQMLTLPGFRSYSCDLRPGAQLLVHNKLSVERLPGLTGSEAAVWALITEAGILEEAGARRDRRTVLGCVAGAGAGDQLGSHLRTLRERVGGRPDFVLLLVGEARGLDADAVMAALGADGETHVTSELLLVATKGVRHDLEEREGVSTVKVDKRLCTILDVGFRTSAELERHRRTPKYNKARLYKYYQSCRAELLKSPHQLGLELEVVEAEAGVEVTEAGLVTIVAKPNEVKRFKIKLRNGRAPEGDETTDPNNPKGIILDRFGLAKDEPVFQLEDDKGLVTGTKLRLKHDKKMKVTVKASCGQIGHYRVPVLVGFYHEVHSDMQRDQDGEMAHVLSHMGLELLLKVQTDEMKELKPTAPYKEVRKVKKWKAKDRIKAPKPEKDDRDKSLNKLEMKLALDHFNMSKIRGKLIFTNFQECDASNQQEKEEYEKCVKIMDSEMTADNYNDRWQLLLHCEEKQLELDIRHYDMEGAKLEKVPNNRNLFSLVVPGLEENRPSVMKGDQIYVKTPQDPRGREFEGYVNQIQEQKVLIGFGAEFQGLHVKNMKFDVRFTVGRYPLRNMHRAVAQAGPNVLGALFPRAELLAPSPGPQLQLPSIRCYNQLIERNTEQLTAVRHIVAGSSGQCPYVVFGPPGTGKTVTMVEAIKQVAKVSAGCHILATAPSNTAADLLTERLLAHILPRDIKRLHAPSRLPSSILNAKVREVSNLDGDRYTYPSVETLQKYKVLVTTLVTAGRLASAQFPPEHFTHVFIDEAGQAQEPETVIAMTGLVRSTQARLVMAGDPRQLGPVIRSQLAVRHGLNVSLLERLMSLDMYNMDGGGSYDQRCITKLVRNFRSHAELLTVPKQLFYNNELEACADQMQVESCLNFEGLPAEAKRNKVPMIFHGVIGQDLKEESSPSFFNIEEVVIVADYIKKLLEMKSNKIQAKEIGVITPYRRQVQKIRQKLRKDEKTKEVMVGSTEEFQGQERRVIIVSTVRSSPEYVYTDNQYKLGFLKNPKRFNVAITRAKALLIVVGNPHILSQDHDWCRLLDWAASRGCYTGCSYTKETDEDVDRLEARFRRLLLEDGEISRMTQLEEPAWRSDA